MENFNGATFKGCDSPTLWLKEQGAPILWVDSWDELEGHLEWALRWWLVVVVVVVVPAVVVVDVVVDVMFSL